MTITRKTTLYGDESWLKTEVEVYVLKRKRDFIARSKILKKIMDARGVIFNVVFNILFMMKY